MLSLLIAIGFIAFGIYRSHQDKAMTALEKIVLIGLLICAYFAISSSPLSHHIIRHIMR